MTKAKSPRATKATKATQTAIATEVALESTTTTNSQEAVMTQEVENTAVETTIATEVAAEVETTLDETTEIVGESAEVISEETTETITEEVAEVISEEVSEEVDEVISEAVVEAVELNATKKTDLLNIDPRAVIFDHSENPRTDYGDLESLKESIKENGVRTAIKIKSNGKDSLGQPIYKLIHGFRRLTAVMELIADGHEIARIPAVAVAKGYSESDAIMDHFTENSGKALNALEQAEVFDRLLKFGWEQAEIARKCAVSPSYVSQLMKLAVAPKSIKETVRKNQISATLVVKLLTRHKEDYNKVNSEIKQALTKLDGKKAAKVTEKTVTVSRVSKYRKLIDADIEAMKAQNYEDRYITKAQKIQDFIDSIATLEGDARLEALCAFSV
jgi:ParB/RepB/Spo0J family partition protein